MTNSERVRDDHPARPSTIALQKWKEMKDQMEYSNDRTWPYHGGSPYAMKVRASVLNTFWRDHISDKCGLGGDTAPYVRRSFAAVPKSTFSYAMRSNGQGRRMERRRMGGTVPRRVHVDKHQGCCVRRTQCGEVEDVVGALTPVVSGVAQVFHDLLVELRLLLVAEVEEGEKEDRQEEG